jgi:hypothetical protein
MREIERKVPIKISVATQKDKRTIGDKSTMKLLITWFSPVSCKVSLLCGPNVCWVIKSREDQLGWPFSMYGVEEGCIQGSGEET